MNGYKTSKDYTHLKDLLDQDKEVICFVCWNFNIFNKEQEPTWVTDICIGKVFCKDNPKYKHYSFNSRGHGFGDYWPSLDSFSFEELCETLKLEYIEPNEDDFWEKCNECHFFDGYDMCLKADNFGSVTDETKLKCFKNNYFLKKT